MCDLDLHKMTLMLKLDPDIMLTYLQTKDSNKPSDLKGDLEIFKKSCHLMYMTLILMYCISITLKLDIDTMVTN